MKSVSVKLEAFEGPFELLYHLIEKNEIDIYDIPIAELTDQYIAYIEKFPKDMETMSSFIVMASNLLEIKSKLLLPSTKEVDLGDPEDPREGLVKKLIEYKRFKEISDFFKVREDSYKNVLFKEPDKDVLMLFQNPKTDIQDVLDGITLNKLYDVFQDVLKRKDLKVDKIRSSFNSVSKDVFTVDDKIDYIHTLLQENKRILFHQLFYNSSMKIEKIVTFLAVLEMIKLKKIRIKQEEIFDEISISFYEDKGN